MTEHSSVFTRKSVLSAAFAVVLAIGMAVPATSAFAAPSDDKKAEANAALQKLNQYQAELDQASTDYQNALQDKIDAEAKVDEANKQIKEKTSEIEQYQSQLSDRAREMYRSGSTTFLDVILGASTFEQFATTWNLLETMNSNDAELVQKTKTARETLESAKAEAEEQAQVASDKAAEAKQVADAADQKASEMQSVYDSLSAEAAELVEQERAAADAAQAAVVARAAQNGTAGAGNGEDHATNNNSNSGNSNAGNSNSGSSNSGSNHSVSKPSTGSSNNNKGQSVSGSKVVSRAYSQLGKPYEWGAGGPNSFDCSGLVGYCLTGSYGHWCTTGTIMGWTRVTNPQPGDICIRSGHTGVYIGGGQMIHAPHTGDVVKVSAVQSGMWFVRY